MFILNLKLLHLFELHFPKLMTWDNCSNITVQGHKGWARYWAANSTRTVISETPYQFRSCPSIFTTVTGQRDGEPGGWDYNKAIREAFIIFHFISFYSECTKKPLLFKSQRDWCQTHNGYCSCFTSLQRWQMTFHHTAVMLLKYSITFYIERYLQEQYNFKMPPQNTARKHDKMFIK